MDETANLPAINRLIRGCDINTGVETEGRVIARNDGWIDVVNAEGEFRLAAEPGTWHLASDNSPLEMPQKRPDFEDAVYSRYDET